MARMYLRKCSAEGDKVTLSRRELEQWRDFFYEYHVYKNDDYYGKYQLLNDILNNL